MCAHALYDNELNCPIDKWTKPHCPKQGNVGICNEGVWGGVGWRYREGVWEHAKDLNIWLNSTVSLSFYLFVVLHQVLSILVMSALVTQARIDLDNWNLTFVQCIITCIVHTYICIYIYTIEYNWVIYCMLKFIVNIFYLLIETWVNE